MLRLFDKDVHGGIDRRGFLDGAAKFAAASGVTAVGLLEALSPAFRAGAEGAPNRSAHRGREAEFDSPQGYGKARGYLAKPAHAGGKPTVLVVHENRRLNPHVEDIARARARQLRRLRAGRAVPLGVSRRRRQGARPVRQARSDEDDRRLRHRGAVPARAARGNGRLGVVGFCYGGGVVNMLTERLPELNAGVLFYGMVLPLDKVASIKAPLLQFFAKNDDRINGAWPHYEAAL